MVVHGLTQVVCCSVPWLQESYVANVAEVLLCEPWLVHRMARKMPELLSMERMALARRLLLLKVRDLSCTAYHLLTVLAELSVVAELNVVAELFCLAFSAFLACCGSCYLCMSSSHQHARQCLYATDAQLHCLGLPFRGTCQTSRVSHASNAEAPSRV